MNRIRKTAAIIMAALLLLAGAKSEEEGGGANMANYREDIVNIDLESGTLHRSFLHHSIGQGDALANRFGVRVFRGKEPVQLAGTCTGYFIRADNPTVPLTNGVINGNEAYVTLTEDCYAVEGVFALAIKITNGSEKVTLRIVDGVVSRTATDAAIDPGNVIGNVEQLIEAIEAAVASIPLDYSSMDTAVERTNDYKATVQSRRYEKQIIDIIGKIKRAVILPDSDDYDSPSGRAVYYFNNINDEVVVYADNSYKMGVIKRNAGDYSYIGYEVNLTDARCIRFTPEQGYIYGLLYSNGDENFTNDMITELNKTTYAYTGDKLKDNDIVPLTYKRTHVENEDIHIGKYYAGGEPLTNSIMAYTDPVAISENRKYYMPYVTFGYTWFDNDGNALGGDYANVEDFATGHPFWEITSPPGAAMVGLSVRSGDAELMKQFSELTKALTVSDEAGDRPVVRSAVKTEELNWIYNFRFNQNRAPSRIYMSRSSESDSWTFTGDYARAIVSGGACIIGSYDLITMDKTKIALMFAIPSGSSPVFVFGYNPYYNGLDIDDGGLAVKISSDGNTAEIRKGSGQNGNYNTLLRSVDISDLNIHSGSIFIITIEKDSVNKQIIKMWNQLTPDTVISETLEAEEATGDENTYINQIRCWGGPYLHVISGTLDVYGLQMYSTAPTYPKIAIWGDSYIENYNRNPECGFGWLLKEELNGNVLISGRGGATAAQGLYRFNTEINTCAPQYVIVCFGVNDSFNTTVEAYKTAIQNYINAIKRKGAKPILVTVPRVDTGTLDNLTWIRTVNPWVRASGYEYIDLAYALSTGDGETPDYSKYMSDKTHPNLKGGQAILNYIKAMLPELLWR